MGKKFTVLILHIDKSKQYIKIVKLLLENPCATFFADTLDAEKVIEEAKAEVESKMKSLQTKLSDQKHENQVLQKSIERLQNDKASLEKALATSKLVKTAKGLVV